MTGPNTQRWRAARDPIIPAGLDLVAAIADLYGRSTIEAASIVHHLGRTQCMRILILTGYMEKGSPQRHGGH